MINYCKEGIPDGPRGSSGLADLLCSIFAFLIRITYLSLMLLALAGSIRLPWKRFYFATRTHDFDALFYQFRFIDHAFRGKREASFPFTYHAVHTGIIL